MKVRLKVYDCFEDDNTDEMENTESGDDLEQGLITPPYYLKVLRQAKK